QAILHRFFQAAPPATIIREHAIGFEHRPMLALKRDVAARKHVVDGYPERTQGLFQALLLMLAVFRKEIGDQNTGFMEDHMAKPDTFVEGMALVVDGPPQIELDTGTVQAHQI